MPDLIRVEVTDQHGTVAEIIDVDAVLGKLNPVQRAALEEMAGQLVRDVAGWLGCGEDHARKSLVAGLIRQVADEAAYERVAERRGVLPL